MNKIEKIHPVTPEVVSNRVVISNKVFKEIVTTLNNAIDTLNILISKYNEDHESIENLRGQIKELAQAMNTLI